MGAIDDEDLPTPPVPPIQPADQPRGYAGRFPPAGPPAEIDTTQPMWSMPQAPAAHGLLHDFANQTWMSTVGMGKDVLGAASAASRALGADPDTVGWIAKQKQSLTDQIQRTYDDLSPQGQMALKASLFGDGTADHPTIGQAGIAHSLAATVANLIPSVALAVLPGGIAARVATKIGLAGAEGLAATAATAGSFGATDAGAAYNEMVAEVDKASPDELMKSPVYAHLIQSGVGDIDARKQLIAAVAPSMGAMHFLAGAAGGAAGGQLLRSGAVGAASKGLLARMGIGAGEGALVMGGQSGADDAINQAANQAFGTQGTYDPHQTALAVASGTVLGGLVGAGGGALHTGHAAASKPALDTETPPVVPPGAEMPPDQLALPAPPLYPQLTNDPVQMEGNGFTVNHPPQRSALQLTYDPVKPETGPVSGRDLRINPSVPMVPPDLALAMGNALGKPPEQAGEAPVTPPAVAPSAPSTVEPPPAAPGGLTSTQGQPAPEAAPPPLAPQGPPPAMRPAPPVAAAPAPAPPAAPTPVTTPSTPATPEPVAADLAAKIASMTKAGRTDEAIIAALAGKVDTADIQAVREQMKAAPPAAPAPEAPKLAATPPPVVVEAKPTEPVAEPKQEPEAKSSTVETPKAEPPPVAPLDKDAQLRADAAAKRAAQKAKMAAPGEKVKGTAYVAPTEPAVETIPGHVQGRIDDATRRAANAMNLPRAIINELSKFTQKLTGKATSEDAAHEAIAKWGNEAKPIPGSKVTSKAVADHILQTLTGKGLVGRAEFAETAAAERQRGGASPKAVVREGETEVAASTTHEHSAEGMTSDYSADAKGKTRSADTTDLERVASDIMQKVHDGSMTPAEAMTAYGTRGPKARAHLRDLPSYIAKQIKEYSSDEYARGIIAKMQEVEKLPPSIAKTNKMEPLHEALNRVDPKYIQDLRNIHAEMVDPVGHAIAGDGRLYKRDMPAQDGLAPGRSKIAGAVADTALNRFIPDTMLAHEAAGKPYTAHTALDAIIQHVGTNRDARNLSELAWRLREIAPNIPVVSLEGAERAGYYGDTPNLIDPKGFHGYYQAARPGITEHIVINPDVTGANPVETLLHEVLHSITRAHIENLRDTNKAHPDYQALEAIREELYTHFDAMRRGMPRQLEDTLLLALQDPHETHAYLMSSPDLQRFAASRVASSEFRQRMSDLGFAPREQGRSVWRAFTDWTRKVLGLKKPATASEYTLLDHVMQPLQDITDRAAKYNESLLPHDPVLRSVAEPLYRQSVSALSKTGRDKVADTLSATNDRLRPAVLLATPLDHIVSRYRRIFNPGDNLAIGGNPLEALRAANEAVAHRIRQFTDAFSDRGTAVVSAFKALPPDQREAVARLQNDATIASARLGTSDPKDNAHLDTPKEQAELKTLQARYAALSDAARDFYNRNRDIQADMGRQEREAEVKGILTHVIPDATAEQRDVFSKAARSDAGLKKFMDDPENSEIAKAFGTDWAKHRGLAKGIAEALRAGMVKGDYFRLGRFGNYVLRYGEKGTDSYGFEMFEKKSEAVARRAELLNQGVDNVEHVDMKDRIAIRKLAVDHPLVHNLENELRKRPDLAEHADAIREIANQLALKAATRADEAKARRKGIQGASLDAGRVLAKDFINTATRVGYAEHGGERYAALGKMRLVAEDLARHGNPGEAIQARQVIAELEHKIAGQEDPTGVLDSAARSATTFGYVQSLMSFSHIITNAIETHSTGSALMAGRHNPGRVALALTKALAELTPQLAKVGTVNTFKALGGKLKTADWNLADLAKNQLIAHGADREQMEALFGAAGKAGLVEHSQSSEIKMMANGGGPIQTRTGDLWNRFTSFMSFSAHAADVVNKSAVMKAAFDLEMRKSGGDVDKSVAYALDTLRQATPNYNLGSGARIGQRTGPLGAFAAPIMQFKKYGLHMYAMLGNLVKASMHGATREERNEARIAFAGVLATHAMMAGSLTLIADPLRYIMGFYDAVTGAAKPHDYQADARRWMAHTFGPQLGEVLARGVPHALGFDVHNRVGLSDLLAIPGMESYDSKGAIKMLGSAMIGAAGQDAATFMDGVRAMRQGDPMGAVKAIAPRPVRDILKAITLADQGVMSGGKVALPASKLSAYDVGLQAIGFQPSDVSEVREGRQAIVERRDEVQSERSSLSAAWIAASPTDKAAVMSQIRVFNQANPLMPPLTVDQMVRQMAAQRKAGAAQKPGDFGLRLPPKAAAALRQAGSFANTPS